MEREPDPIGTCPSCGGWLEWSSVRYLPAARIPGGFVEPRWEGCRPRCAVNGIGPGACPPVETDGRPAVDLSISADADRAALDAVATGVLLVTSV